ncbi:MAG: tRNA pseudouridine(38-40) synthase TruA [Acutalibacteraceae bacterium]
MRNLLFIISFDGKRYHGWQSQKNAPSVQETVKSAFKSITGEKAKIIGCSRTDARVHANMFAFSVKTSSRIPTEKFVLALNAKLPDDIAASKCIEVDEDFNARFSCRVKEYKYLIYNGNIRNPFYSDRAYFYPYPLDEKRLDETAKYFLGTHDFSAFCSSGASVVSKVRTIYDAEVTRNGEMVIFTISGDGFLYNMVRIIVGTLLYTETGKIKKEEIPEIIHSLDRKRAGITVPPAGLYLNKVFFDFDI